VPGGRTAGSQVFGTPRARVKDSHHTR
jgi:hypothetical protein